ncbi:MAG: NgoFVII family restriction endonuclease [Chloroflexi bacterium]|nr:NgoFVII family restriction endonuclease [Chloroflexota bacterium]
MATNISFEIIENRGPNNLRDVLRAKFPKATEVCIAVAFVTESGVHEIIQALRQVSAHGKVRFVTGLYQSVTEPAALRTLLKLQQASRGNLSVRLSREPKFHRKIFLAEGKSRATAIIGSSNLTREGLNSGGELDVMVSLPKSTGAYKRLKDSFEKDWDKRRAVPLTIQQIAKYERSRAKTPIPPSYSQGQLKRILGTDPKHERSSSTNKAARYWRDYFESHVKPRTEKVIEEETNWDEVYDGWFGGNVSPGYQEGDRVFFFDLNSKRKCVYLVEIKETTRTAVPTPDGRHFAAYNCIGMYRRNFSQGLWKDTKTLGITESEIRKAQKLDSVAAKHLMRSIQKKPK